MRIGPQRKKSIITALIVGICTLIQAAPNATAKPVEQLSSGTSSRSAKKQALDSIPYQQLNEATREKIAPILQKPSIYRRLPITAINVDPDYFVYLVRYPEVIVNIWKIMGVTEMVTNRTDQFRVSTNDGAGTISNVELLYGTANMHIFLGEGTYEGPVLKRKLKGSCVLILRTEFNRDANGVEVATNSLDVFLKVDNATANLVAKTLNPIVGKTADHNFVESLNFIQRLNETTCKNGPGVQRMANRLTDVSTKVRQDFIQMAGVVYERNDASPTASSRPAVRPTSFQSRPGPGQPAQFLRQQPTNNMQYAVPPTTSYNQRSNPPLAMGFAQVSNPNAQFPVANRAERSMSSRQVAPAASQAGNQAMYNNHQKALPPIVSPTPRVSSRLQQPSYRAPQYPKYNYTRR